MNHYAPRPLTMKRPASLTRARAGRIMYFYDPMNRYFAGQRGEPIIEATPEEAEYIEALWDSMPGWTSRWDAVNRIRKGEDPT